WEYHDTSLVDPATGRLDTLPHFRATLAASGLEDQVIAIVGTSAAVSALWRGPPGRLVLDGGPTPAPARAGQRRAGPGAAPGGAGGGGGGGACPPRACPPPRRGGPPRRS